jgi:hypothetical protein
MRKRDKEEGIGINDETRRLPPLRQSRRKARELATRLSTVDEVPRDVLTPLTPHLALQQPSPSLSLPHNAATLPVDDLIRGSSPR